MGFFKPNVKKMQAENDVEGLIKTLSHKDENVRHEALLALWQVDIGSIVQAELGDKGVLAALTKLTLDESKIVRETVVPVIVLLTKKLEEYRDSI